MVVRFWSMSFLNVLIGLIARFWSTLMRSFLVTPHALFWSPLVLHFGNPRAQICLPRFLVAKSN